jgi:predicted nucleic acid-binding protein
MNAADLRGAFFLDTNVLVYGFDVARPGKQARAREWVRSALVTQRGIISSQVVQEFLNVALSRFATPLSTAEARDYLHAVLRPLCQHFPSTATYEQALMLREETGFSWYDCLILSAAIETRCATLLSEDLQDGRTVRGTTIRNPFKD